MIDDYDECGKDGEMIGRGNWSTRRRPAVVLLSPPQIPHYLSQSQTRASSVGSRGLNVWDAT
jgi:hypothetical protein